MSTDQNVLQLYVIGVCSITIGSHHGHDTEPQSLLNHVTMVPLTTILKFMLILNAYLNVCIDNEMDYDIPKATGMTLLLSECF